MKKFLAGAATLIILLYLLNTAYYTWGFYIDLHPETPVSFAVQVREKEIYMDSGSGFEPFHIRGVDMGAGIPGHFATDYAIDKETYMRWFGEIKAMGANTIHVYTLLGPAFYEAVYEYNAGNPDPLYIIHGVWVNDYVQNSHVDAYDDSFLDTFIKDCRTLVDVIHGRKKLNLGYSTSSASGSYTKDISSWVLGYILGVEWEDVTVAYTDQMQSDKSVYMGEYMYTSPEATPFEAMLAQTGDELIRYESDKYKQQRLVAFSNWPTTDPLSYPEEVLRLFMKCAQVDVEHILSTDKFLAGQFASYHVYAYYPDYLSYYESWKTQAVGRRWLEDGQYNTYGAYLDMLNQHHTMPVIISEYGVPTSRGIAQNDITKTRTQGYMSEKDQGQAIIDSYEDIKKAGCAGSIIFTWQDEWFKRTWNTMANVDLTKTPFWSDYQTNEQYFGLLSFDPGKEESICYTDGDVSEWSESDRILSNPDFDLYGKYDEKYIYLRIHGRFDFENEKLYIPVDVTPKTGSYYARAEGLRFERPADFLIILDGEENSRILVQERYDAFRAVFYENFGGENPFIHPPDKDSPEFVPVYLALQIGQVMDPLTDTHALQKFETGRLTYGNGNPDSEDFNSLSDFIIHGDDVEIRLPWQLLNFSNPSEMQIHDDYYEHFGIENLGIDSIYLGVGTEGSGRIAMGALDLEGWGRKVTSHERLKQSYYMIRDYWKQEDNAKNLK